MSTLRNIAELRALYDVARPRSVFKELPRLDVHAQRIVGLSPMLVLATYGADGRADASPRGGDPGFVKLLDAHTLLIPDAPGNNRLDTLENIVATPDQAAQVGLLFVVPGVDETLRVNGTATLSTQADWLALCQDSRRTPKLVIRVQVHSCYVHCAKALMRSDLWNPAKHVPRSTLASMGEMLRDQTAQHMPADTVYETQEQMLKRYQDTM
jgi:uncharacterized protein